MAAASNPEVPGVDHPVSDWQRDQPSISLAPGRAVIRLLVALEPDVEAERD